MNKDIWLSILRSVLTAVGAYLAGKYFLGTAIDDNLWAGIGGSILTIASIIWGIWDKTATTEMVQSGLRSVIITFGTLLVGAGIIKDELLKTLLEIVSLLVPVLLSQASRVKSKSIATGKIAIADLSGVDPKKIPITPDTTPLEKKDNPNKK